MKQVLLTGDRPSGMLHLGHYVGSLQNRVQLQGDYESYIFVADVQALAACWDNPKLLRESVVEVVKDYLAVGIDPDVATIFLQSQVPEIAELTIYYMNLVTLARLERNPTVKTELEQKGMSDSVPVGFLCHPINQAADITAFGAEVIPVGEDQLPLLEQCNEIVRRFNRIYNVNLLKECRPLLGAMSRLPGIDGKAKASKSLGNAIYLADTPELLKEKVMAMYTDPQHIKVSDPGHVEGNIVFTYLDVFHSDKEEVNGLKEQYCKGGLGDVTLKKLLLEDLNALLQPVRERRLKISANHVFDVLKTGTARARCKAQATLESVREAIGVRYFEG